MGWVGGGGGVVVVQYSCQIHIGHSDTTLLICHKGRFNYSCVGW